jgi:pimeloyl-ACP methyl ester carboxylesterase
MRIKSSGTPHGKERVHRPTVLSPTLEADIRMLKRIWPLLPLLAAVATVFVLVWWSAGLLISPHESWSRTVAPPARFGLSPKTVRFQSLDGLNLKAWWERPGTMGEPRGTLILVHGSNMNKSSMAYPGGKLLAHGYTVLIPDLRGHGESTGHYATGGYMEALDVLGAIRWVNRQKDHGPIGLVGYSSGAVAVLQAAAQAPEVAAVVADSAFLSISDLLAREIDYLNNRSDISAPLSRRLRLWLFSAPAMRPLARWSYNRRAGVPLEPPDKNVLDAVAKIVHPHVLYLRAGDDPVVPSEVTGRLFEHTATRDKRLVVMPGAVHSAMVSDPRRYIDTIEGFLDDATGGGAAAPAGDR